MTLMEPAVAPPKVGTSRCFGKSQRRTSHHVIQKRDQKKTGNDFSFNKIGAKTDKSSELDSCDGPVAHPPQT